MVYIDHIAEFAADKARKKTFAQCRADVGVVQCTHNLQKWKKGNYDVQCLCLSAQMSQFVG